MNNLSNKYRLSIYSEISELSKDKVYIVKSSLDDKIYIKKILDPKKYDIYNKLRNISSSNIPKIYEIMKFENKLIVIEEYINGCSLNEILVEFKTLPESKVIKYALDLSDILYTLHSCDPPIIHRDIKPSNLMINNDGFLKLIDFDISRTHKTSESSDTNILGTYGYAAPEQFGFNQSDARTDIYSLGVTMNMLLVGKLPVNGIYEGNLSSVISKCIQLDPEQRFQNVNELKLTILKKSNEFKNKGKMSRYYTKFKMPGFRSRKLLFKIISSIWYVFLTLALFGFFTEDPSFQNRVLDVIMVGFLFTLTLFYGNFNNVKSKLPLVKSRRLFVKFIGYVFYTLLLLIISMIFMPE
ncbi:serine/threonine protein kinase [Clostridium sp. D2Q-14]|uniref:serine/threonine-protein kinase n=1 Tax=Anaeromonas gelatinilytica TaxID=2683194 RepID=UPI00193B4BDD|nr:serine/threonine-protein kinase [Anaeromonas gelatinilytica]MBS4536379.1 serine/threonine protein kinase [Anaeromonas gelatinilytica]